MFKIWKGIVVVLILCAIFGLHKINSSPTKNPEDLNRTIASIFNIGNEDGVQLFNQNYPTHGNFDSNNQQTQSQQAFKVQRTANGKLNVVFNDSLLLQKNSETAPMQRNMSANGNFKVTFPDQRRNPYAPRCEEANKGKPFCEEVGNYPELVNLKTVLSKFEVFFGDDLAQPKNIDARIGNDPSEESLCQSVEKIVYPKKGETKDSQWLFIINDDNNYKQGIRIEECLNPGKPCNALDSLPNNYNATCKQNYIYRSLVALTNDGKVTKDHFRMPSCCQCVLTHV